MWLPPTPPSEDFDDIYVDTSLDMKYDTQSTISPAVLAAIAPFRLGSDWARCDSDSLCKCSCSEEDYDVFGLRRLNIDSSKTIIHVLHHSYGYFYCSASQESVKVVKATKVSVLKAF